MNASGAHLAAAALAVSLVAGTAGSARAGDGRSALQLLPYDTSSIVAFNVERFRKAPVYPDVVALLPANAELAVGLEMIEKRAAFDVDKHLDTVVIGFPNGLDQSDDLIIVAEGTFDQAKLTELAKDSGEARVEYRNVEYFQTAEIEILFLPDRIVIATLGHITRVIDVHLARARPVTANAQVMQLVASADTGLDAWMTAPMPTSIRDGLARQLGGAMIEGLVVSVDLQSGLAARMLLTAATEADATTLSTFVTSALAGLKKDNSFQALGLGSAFNSIAVTQAKSTVELSFTITAAELSIIRQLARSF